MDSNRTDLFSVRRVDPRVNAATDMAFKKLNVWQWRSNMRLCDSPDWFRKRLRYGTEDGTILTCCVLAIEANSGDVVMNISSTLTQFEKPRMIVRNSDFIVEYEDGSLEVVSEKNFHLRFEWDRAHPHEAISGIYFYEDKEVHAALAWEFDPSGRKVETSWLWDVIKAMQQDMPEFAECEQSGVHDPFVEYTSEFGCTNDDSTVIAVIQPRGNRPPMVVREGDWIVRFGPEMVTSAGYTYVNENLRVIRPHEQNQFEIVVTD